MIRYEARLKGQPAWEKPEDMPRALWMILAGRGVQSAQAAERFLHPTQGDLLAPEALHDMDRAVARIMLAKMRQETVYVWGDYDVDGVCASAILQLALKHLGIQASGHIPSRRLEGYGLNEPGILEAAKCAQLLVTVDCGITSSQLVERAKALGMDVIVTDHHQLGEQLPDCPVVNPLMGGYPNPDLAGAGVAFKLAMALCPECAMEWIDLAALATVADVVKLQGENRAIVFLGLELINRAARPGIKALMDASGIAAPISAGQVAFQLAPRLNAGGRLGSAERSLELLKCACEAEAAPLARALNDENTRRKAEEAAILREAEAQLAGYDFVKRRVIVLAGEKWNPGVVGLVASRLVEKYTLPVVLLSLDDEMATGSCRSIPGVNIFEALCAASDLLIRYGGHKQAAGLTLERGKIDALRARLNEWICENADAACFIPLAPYDLAVSLDEVDLALVEALDRMNPTGFGNPAPVLLSQGYAEDARGVGRDCAHLALTFSQAETALRGIWFSQGKRLGTLDGIRQAALFAPRIDRYMNRVSVQLEIKAMRPQTLAAALEMSEADEARWLHAFLTQILYNSPQLGRLSGAKSAAWDVQALCEALRGDARGTLVLAADRQIAQVVLAQLDEAGLSERMDVCRGGYPSDLRAFNALCLFPVGEIPPGYERVFLLGAPGALFHASGPVLGVAEWIEALPDVARLRALYRATRELLRRPYAGKRVQALACELSELSGLEPVGAHAGLYVLNELQLIDFSPEPLTLAMRPVVKVEPETSELFRWMGALREWGGGLL
ncbi:MAG: single-stranded-DNA-specific exonuclease RecJ [Clostridia bacterium]